MKDLVYSLRPRAADAGFAMKRIKFALPRSQNDTPVFLSHG